MSQLSQHVLRITTAGSVDDGKSTLIGRLLYESQAVLDDQWEALHKARLINGQPDLSLLTDGLKSEREQGITIDVAYKYFSSQKRKFILADAPGHVQYTRNMVTAASRADVAILLVDARSGVVEQTRRHSYLISLLGVPHVIVAINKIDAIDFDAERIKAIEHDFRALPWVASAPSLSVIPISALRGDNVSTRSQETPWYQGPHLLELLESLEPVEKTQSAAKLAVQYILRDRQGRRFAAGQLQTGTLRVGDDVRIWPSQQSSRIQQLYVHGHEAIEARAGESLAITLQDERDLDRGSLIFTGDVAPETATELEADLVWFDEEAQRSGERYILRLGTQQARAEIVKLSYRFDLEQLKAQPAEVLERNDIARVSLVSSRPLALERFEDQKQAGAFILIDPRSFRTVAAGLVTDFTPGLSAPRAGGRFTLVQQLASAPNELDDKVLQIPSEWLSANKSETQIKVLETLWESGWQLVLEKSPEAEWLQKRLARKGLGGFEHGLGI